MNAITKLTIQDVRQHLVSLSPDIARSLPPGVSPERFTTVSLTAIQNAPKLLECEPQSLFNACMKAAQDGLLPDGREGAIVPRYNKRAGYMEASWQPMVAGIQAKAKRRGNVASLSANVVYQGEVFEVLLGDEDRIIHRRDMAKVKQGKEIAVYAIAVMKDGSKEREVMSWDQVMTVRQASGDPNSVPWTKWTDEMARKSCIRRLSKRLPSLDDGDDDLKAAIERVDELYPFGKDAPKTLDARPEPAPLDDAIPDRGPATNGAKPSVMDRIDSIRAELAAAPDEAAVKAIGGSSRVQNALRWLMEQGDKQKSAYDELNAVLAEAYGRVKETSHDPDTGEVAEPEFPGDR